MDNDSRTASDYRTPEQVTIDRMANTLHVLVSENSVRYQANVEAFAKFQADARMNEHKAVEKLMLRDAEIKDLNLSNKNLAKRVKSQDEQLELNRIAIMAAAAKTVDLQAHVAERDMGATPPPDVAAKFHVSIHMIYTNYEGTVSKRNISPVKVFWGSTEFHSEPQWLLKAYCHDRESIRDFALRECDFISAHER